MFTSFITVLALAGAANAATINGYGRYPCTLVNGDNTNSADQSRCATGAIVPVGDGSGNAPVSGFTTQGNGVQPVGSFCVVNEHDSYYCGGPGAACPNGAIQCDNGQCQNGVCTGGFLANCAGADSNCSGYLYCTDTGGAPVTNQCGSIGAFCQDTTTGSTNNTPAQNEAIFNQFCQSQYCSLIGGTCDTHAAAGESCASDPQFKCGAGLTCTSATAANPNVCVLANNGSARARARRDEHSRRASNLCPASHTACAITGGAGFECVDTKTNLEQCGGCAAAEGVDCTALPGVEAVGCVAGRCEVWSCAETHVYDAAASACVLASA